MEQTIGKRISCYRKQMKLTQDQLAERLGVTAQAVSKWENDQSCPDITTLPRLAEIFNCSTDELLGITPAGKVHDGEIVGNADDTSSDDSLHISTDGAEFTLVNSQHGTIGFAVLVLAVGGIYLAAQLLKWDVSFWNILWPTTLLVFGLFSNMRLLSFGRLGCIILGAYFLLDNLNVLPFQLGWKLALPAALLLLGVCLLIKAVRQPKHSDHTFHFHNNNPDHKSSCSTEGESFNCNCSFCEDRHYVELPRLAEGSVSISFGETVVDLSGVQEVAEPCEVSVNVSFGECIVLVPSRFRVELAKNVVFGSASLNGQPDSATSGTIYLTTNVSFGEAVVKYI